MVSEASLDSRCCLTSIKVQRMLGRWMMAFFFFFSENKKPGKGSKGCKKVSWYHSQVRYIHCWGQGWEQVAHPRRGPQNQIDIGWLQIEHHIGISRFGLTKAIWVASAEKQQHLLSSHHKPYTALCLVYLDRDCHNLIFFRWRNWPSMRKFLGSR